VFFPFFVYFYEDDAMRDIWLGTVPNGWDGFRVFRRLKLKRYFCTFCFFLRNQVMCCGVLRNPGVCLCVCVCCGGFVSL